MSYLRYSALVLSLLLFSGAASAAPCPPILLFGAAPAGASDCGNAPTSTEREPVSGFFLDPDGGNDNNNGRSPNSAWKSIARAEAVLGNRTDSPDLWLKSGGVFEDQRMVVTWRGRTSDLAHIGCYRMQSGEAVRCLASDPKPEINGTFELSDRRQGYTSYPFGGTGSSVTGSVPADVNTGLLHVADNLRDAYLWIENIQVKDSAGDGFRVGAHVTHVAIVDTVALDSGHISYAMRYGADDILVKNFVIDGQGYCQSFHEDITHRQDASRVPDTCKYDYPAAIITAERGERIIIMGGDIKNTWGEGIGAFKCNSSLVIGNKVRDTKRNAIYNADCSNTVVAYNIVWDTDYEHPYLGRELNPATGRWDSGNYRSNVGISNNVETDLALPKEVDNFFAFGNIVYGAQQCFDQVTWRPARFSIEGEWYNNVCVTDSTDRAVDFVTGSGHDDTNFNHRLVFRNNIVYAPNTSGMCRASAYRFRDFSNNIWSSSVSSSCDGPAQSVETPNMALSVNNWNRSRFTQDQGPTFADARVLSGRALGGGTDILSTMPDVSSWYWWPEVDHPFDPANDTAFENLAFAPDGQAYGNPRNIGVDG